MVILQPKSIYLHNCNVLAGSPRFTLSQDRSIDGSPSVAVTFPDGYSDTLILSRYYNNERDRLESSSDRCHFIGHLKSEPEACVAMTGCPGQDDLEFTIMSQHAQAPIHVWKKDGSVKVIESIFRVKLLKYKTVRSISNSLNSRMVL